MSESRPRGNGNRRAVGRRAEDQAAEFLRGLGFTIVTRNYTVKGGELDLVAVDGDELVFIEVRQRRGAVGAPEESLGPKKAGRLRVAARAYLAALSLDNANAQAIKKLEPMLGEGVMVGRTVGGT